MNLLEIILDYINSWGDYSLVSYFYQPIYIDIDVNEDQLWNMVEEGQITKQDAEIFLSKKGNIEQDLSDAWNECKQKKAGRKELTFKLVNALKKYNLSKNFIIFIVKQFGI